MNIQIKVSEPISNMNQRESQCVKRAAEMLRANGYDVTIWWAEILPSTYKEERGLDPQEGMFQSHFCEH
jgi:hypothetical protein